jgi:hypothetical protein
MVTPLPPPPADPQDALLVLNDLFGGNLVSYAGVTLLLQALRRDQPQPFPIGVCELHDVNTLMYYKTTEYALLACCTSKEDPHCYTVGARVPNPS